MVASMPTKHHQTTRDLIRSIRKSPGRRAKALERYLAGETMTAIAASMGLSKQRVSQMIKRARAEQAAA
jgi:DNA-directed RNA polymerase specialized sigma subunit